MIRSALLGGVLALWAATGQAVTDEPSASQLAFCAGVYEAEVEQSLEDAGPEALEYQIEAAHIFYALAWAEAGDESRSMLFVDRLDGRNQVVRLSGQSDAQSEDELHGHVQFCSDIQQQFLREDRFRLP